MDKAKKYYWYLQIISCQITEQVSLQENIVIFVNETSSVKDGTTQDRCTICAGEDITKEETYDRTDVKRTPSDDEIFFKERERERVEEMS